MTHKEQRKPHFMRAIQNSWKFRPEHNAITQLTGCRFVSLFVFWSNLRTCFRRYREKEREYDQKQQPHHQYQQHISYQKHSNFNSKYSLDLEHDHALPTSAPNADILKSNSNPTYPNPNRHHNHGHRAHLNSTPSLAGRSLRFIVVKISIYKTVMRTKQKKAIKQV